MFKSNEPPLKRHRSMDHMNEPSSPLGDQQPDSSQVEEHRNSLLRLNDYCLRDVFNRLDKRTLCRLADVSTRVQSIAKKAFAERHTKEYLRKSVALFRQIICKFGQLITSVDLGYCHEENCSQEQINAIVKYCPNVEILRIGLENHLELVAISFPKLVKLILTSLHFSIDTFRKLLSLNPQLQQLDTYFMASEEHITAIIQHAKNLEELTIEFPSNKLTKEIILQLVELKKLKCFRFFGYVLNIINFVASLMTAFSMQNVNLKSLHLEGISIDSNDVNSISDFKELEHLCLGAIECVPDEIISLVKELPLLSSLRLIIGDSYMFSVADLINMVKAGKKLNKIMLRNVRNFKIDQKRFEDLFEAASNRLNQDILTIGILGFGTHVDVPHDIRYGNQHKLLVICEKYC